MKEQEATLAIVLLTPAMEMQASGEAWCWCWRRPSARSRCWAMMEALELSLYVQ